MVQTAIPFFIFKTMKNSRIILLLSGLILFSCTTVEKTSKTDSLKQPEIYVFHDVEKADTAVSVIDTIKTEPETSDSIRTENIPVEKLDTVMVPEKHTVYIVQIGAFSTMERAESFIKTNRLKTEYKLNVQLNQRTKLFVVQLQPFITKESAEKAKTAVKQIPAFKDAFIITVEE